MTVWFRAIGIGLQEEFERLVIQARNRLESYKQSLIDNSGMNSEAQNADKDTDSKDSADEFPYRNEGTIGK